MAQFSLLTLVEAERGSSSAPGLPGVQFSFLFRPCLLSRAEPGGAACSEHTSLYFIL